MEFWIKASQLLLSLSILVILHELGHFLPAKWFKTRVEKFYLFFNPWFSLFKVKKGETEYGLGWLPLGGYVKIAGMVDESMDKEQMALPPKPYEFRAKPAWQRLIIMLGGVTVNLLLGIAIYISVLYVWGREYLPMDGAKYGVHCAQVMKEEGFEDGDVILAVGGKQLESFGDIGPELLLNNAREITVMRNGQQKSISLSDDIDEKILERGVKQLFFPRIPMLLDSVNEGGSADKAGLKKGDKIVGANEIKSSYFHDFQLTLSHFKDSSVTVYFERSGQLDSTVVAVSGKGTIGIVTKGAAYFLDFKTEKYGLLESIPAGFEDGINTLTNYIESLKLIFSPAGVKQIGGFGTIGGLFGSQWDWLRFWKMTAFLSIMLAFLNVLPIPALDGGHVMFLIYEMIAGKPPKQKVLEYAQLAGMILLVALVLYANGNDLFKLLK